MKMIANDVMLTVTGAAACMHLQMRDIVSESEKFDTCTRFGVVGRFNAVCFYVPTYSAIVRH